MATIRGGNYEVGTQYDEVAPLSFLHLLFAPALTGGNCTLSSSFWLPVTALSAAGTNMNSSRACPHRAHRLMGASGRYIDHNAGKEPGVVTNFSLLSFRQRLGS